MCCVCFSVFEQDPQRDARVAGVMRVEENSWVLERHCVYLHMSHRAAFILEYTVVHLLVVSIGFDVMDCWLRA